DTARMRLRVLTVVGAATMLTAPAAASAAFPHVVAPGESLSSVAAEDGLSVEQLAAANGLPAGASLLAGSRLMIPPQATGTAGAGTGVGETASSTGETASRGGETASSTEAPANSASGSPDGDGDADDAESGEAGAGQGSATSSTSTASNGGSYVVQPGDTLSAIAARAGTSVG